MSLFFLPQEASIAVVEHYLRLANGGLSARRSFQFLPLLSQSLAQLKFAHALVTLYFLKNRWQRFRIL
jgi:hypothetical protein